MIGSCRPETRARRPLEYALGPDWWISGQLQTHGRRHFALGRHHPNGGGPATVDADGQLESVGRYPLGPTTYAAPRSAFAIHSGSTIRGVGTAGSNPLAPTRLTDRSGELERGRQGDIQPQFDGVGCQLVLQPLEAQNVGAREDRGGDRLAANGAGIRP